jgi:NAD(P)H dehydrogenase (quinone)
MKSLVAPTPRRLRSSITSGGWSRVLGTIAIVYYSATGTTARLAEALQEGAAKIANVECCRIVGDDIVAGRFQNNKLLTTVDAADGVIFGSPTYMGGPAAQFKAFADATSDRWNEQRWANKVAAGFTTGVCANGDQSHTLAYFTILAAQHGMLWCNLDIPGGQDGNGRNRLGNQLGLVTQMENGTLPESDVDTARHLGARLASVANRLAGKIGRS